MNAAAKAEDKTVGDVIVVVFIVSWFIFAGFVVWDISHSDTRARAARAEAVDHDGMFLVICLDEDSRRHLSELLERYRASTQTDTSK